MLKNIGKCDRALRIVAGAVLLALVFVGPKTLWGLLGLVPLVSGLGGICPAYAVTGVSTCQAGCCKAKS